MRESLLAPFLSHSQIDDFISITEKQLGKVKLTRVDSLSQGILLFAPEEAEERRKTAEEEIEDARCVNVETVNVEAGGMERRKGNCIH